MPNNPPSGDNRDRVREFVKMWLSHNAQYHNHKETMAHAGILLQIGLAVGIMSMKYWPPKWVPPVKIPEEWVAFIGFAAIWPPIKIPEEWVAFIGFAAIWSLIHIYVIWQLRMRRVAAIRVADSINYLKPPKNNKTQRNDLVKPFIEMKHHKGKGGELVLYECLVLLGSALMFIIVIYRTFASVAWYWWLFGILSIVVNFFTYLWDAEIEENKKCKAQSGKS